MTVQPKRYKGKIRIDTTRPKFIQTGSLIVRWVE